LRSSDCQSNPAFVEFDKCLRQALSTILNVAISDAQWTRASLLLRNGGLGIHSAVMLALSALMASACTMKCKTDLMNGTQDQQGHILLSHYSSIKPGFADIVEVQSQHPEIALHVEHVRLPVKPSVCLV